MLNSNEPFDVRACLCESRTQTSPLELDPGCLKLHRLIEIKCAASRPRDLEAVAELQTIAAEMNGRAEI